MFKIDRLTGLPVMEEINNYKLSIGQHVHFDLTCQSINF